MMNTIIPLNALDQIFNSFGVESAGNCTARPGRAHQARRIPDALVFEGDEEYRISLDMPGVAREDIEIGIENESLTIKATRENTVPEGFRARHCEFPQQVTFGRSFNLGREIDRDNISAKLDGGVLNLVLRKTKQALPRRIEIG